MQIYVFIYAEITHGNIYTHERIQGVLKMFWHALTGLIKADRRLNKCVDWRGEYMGESHD